MDFSGFEPIMPEDLLQAGGAHAFLYAIDSGCVPQKMWRDGLGDRGPIHDPLDYPLGSPFRKTDAVIGGEMQFKKSLGPYCGRDDPSLTLAARPDGDICQLHQLQPGHQRHHDRYRR